MPQPTPYTRTYDFTGYQEQYPEQPLPAAPLDANFDLVGISTGQLASRAGLIQRDDGQLRNKIVSPDSLSNTVLAMLGTDMNPRGDWVGPGTDYKKLDLVGFNGVTYICVLDHTSSASFNTDLTAGRWLLFSNPAVDEGTSFFQKISGTGAQTVFSLSADLGVDPNALMVFIDNGTDAGFQIMPPDSYAIDGTELTFDTAPALGAQNGYIFAPSLLLGAVGSAAADAIAARDAAIAAQGASEDARDDILNNAGFIVVASDLLGSNTIGIVAGSITAVNTVATNIATINTVNTNITAINTVAGAIAAVNTVSTNIASVNNASSNMAAIIAAPTQAANAATSATNASNAQTAAEAARDIAIAQAAGMRWKNSARAKTTANRTLSGLTNTSLDGVTPIAGNRILVTEQTTSSQNGIYVAAAGAWTRATDMDLWTEVPSAVIAIEEGTTAQDTIWICTSNTGGTIGSTAITFVQYAGAARSLTSDKFAGNGTAGPFALTGAPGSDNNVQIYVSGVYQTPGVDYSITGSSLAFLSGSFPPVPAAGVTNNIVALYGQAQPINVPAAASVQYTTLAASVLASLGDWAAGTASKILTAANFLPALAAAIGFNKFFESAEQTITNAGFLTVPHGLGAIPKDFDVFLVCKTADLGFPVGCKMKPLVYGSTSAALSSSGLSPYVDATNIYVQIGTTGIGVNRVSATVGNTVLITNANWRIIVTAKG